MIFKSFDIMKMVLETANERFCPRFLPVEERMEILEQYCGEIDKVMEEGDCEEITCDVDEIDLTLHISIHLESIQSCVPNSPLQKLMSRALFVDMKNDGDEHVAIHFVFPSVWEKNN